jgi:hypothetical protein
LGVGRAASDCTLYKKFIAAKVQRGNSGQMQGRQNRLFEMDNEIKIMDQVEEDLKRMKIIGWRAKVEDRQEWNRIVEQTKTHLGL